MSFKKITGFLCTLVTPSMYATQLHEIPGTVLEQIGLNTHFIAQGALFLAIMLLGTIFIGRVLKTFLQVPTIAGYIIGGVVLGPSVLNIQKLSFFSEPLSLVDSVANVSYSLIPADFFVLFIFFLSALLTVSYLLWLAGYETNVRDLMKVGTTAVTAGFLGAFFSVLFVMFGIMWLYPGVYSLVTAMGIGLVFAATSISIPIAMLVSSNKMHLKSSQATLGAAIVDDIIAVVMVSVFMMAVQSGLFGECAVSVCKTDCSILRSLLFMAVSTVVIILFGYLVVPPIIQKLRDWNMSHLIAPVATGIMLLYFAFADLVGGLAGITGAYFAGVFQRVADTKRAAEKVCAPFVNSVLLPLFLGSIGLQVDVTVLTVSEWGLVCVLLLLTSAAKLAGCYASTSLSNFSARRKGKIWTFFETYLFGASMVARGEVDLVVATILRGAHIITPQMYVLCVVVILLTTIVAPVMLSIGFTYLDDQELLDDHSYKINLGLFPVIGTQQMFHIIVSQLETRGNLNTKVMITEGRTIIDSEKERIKVIFCPQEGVIFEGNRAKIKQIISLVKQEILHEIDQISSTT